jgi:hypothetical protein
MKTHTISIIHVDIKAYIQVVYKSIIQGPRFLFREVMLLSYYYTLKNIKKNNCDMDYRL